MAGMYFVFGLLLLCALAALIGLVEARTKRRDAVGSFGSIIASIVGAIGGGMAVGAAMDASVVFKQTGPEVSGVLILAGMMLGGWLALRLVNRLRD